MKRRFLTGYIMILFCSCASLTKTQITTVNQFAKTSENFSLYPGTILEELADVRLRSGVYFANSLDDPRLHLKELDDIYTFKRGNVLLSAKADITFKIIDKYAQSLLLLSSDKYASNAGSRAQAFGENMDSLVTLYNKVSDGSKLPSGIGSGVSQWITAGGRLYIRTRQAREIKKFVVQADTLIGLMTANLIEFLRATNLKELIENEEKSATRNYLSYLRQRSTVATATGRTDTSKIVSDTKSSVQNDMDYIGIKSSLDAIRDLRDQTVVATRKLRTAHAKLKEAIIVKKTLRTTIFEIQDLYTEVRKIRLIITLMDKFKR